VSLSQVARTESVLDARDNYKWLGQHQREIPSINWTAPPAVKSQHLDNIANKARNLAGKYAKLHGESFTGAASFLNRFAALLDAQRKSSPQPASDRLSEWQRVFVNQLRAMLQQFSPPPLDIGKVPAEMRGHFVA